MLKGNLFSVICEHSVTGFYILCHTIEGKNSQNVDSDLQPFFLILQGRSETKVEQSNLLVRFFILATIQSVKLIVYQTIKPTFIQLNYKL